MTLFKIFLFAHILSGGTGLLAGLTSMIAAKGKPIHRLAGKVFFWAMLGVFITSIYMSIEKSNWFLLAVGFLSFYLTCSGTLVLKAKVEKNNDSVKHLYLAVCLFGFLGGLGFFVLSINMFTRGYVFGIVPLVFGVLSCFQSSLDYRRITLDRELKDTWLRSHALRMAGAFAATLTAFVVVNIQIDQQWVLWLLPAAVVLPVARRMVAKLQHQ